MIASSFAVVEVFVYATSLCDVTVLAVVLVVIVDVFIGVVGVVRVVDVARVVAVGDLLLSLMALLSS